MIRWSKLRWQADSKGSSIKSAGDSDAHHNYHRADADGNTEKRITRCRVSAIVINFAQIAVRNGSSGVGFAVTQDEIIFAGLRHIAFQLMAVFVIDGYFGLCACAQTDDFGTRLFGRQFGLGLRANES